MVVKFPYEEDATQEKPRPVVVLDVETLEVLSVKVTKVDQREDDLNAIQESFMKYFNSKE